MKARVSYSKINFEHLNPFKSFVNFRICVKLAAMHSEKKDLYSKIP